MKRIKSISDKRLIIEAKVNNKDAFFLIDTGATVGLIDESKIKGYNLTKGRAYNGTLVGAGGEMRNVKHCDTFVEFEGKKISQFLLADIKRIVESIKRETGIEILGIISLPQMSFIGMNIDINSSEVWLE